MHQYACQLNQIIAATTTTHICNLKVSNLQSLIPKGYDKALLYGTKQTAYLAVPKARVSVILMLYLYHYVMPKKFAIKETYTFSEQMLSPSLPGKSVKMAPWRSSYQPAYFDERTQRHESRLLRSLWLPTATS